MASFSVTSSIYDTVNEQAEPQDQCWQCGKMKHTDKMLSDQCRLMTAILGPRWGYNDEAPTKDKKKTVTFDQGVEVYTFKEPGMFDEGWNKLKRKTPVYPVIEETWREELDLLTRFSSYNRGSSPPADLGSQRG